MGEETGLALSALKFNVWIQPNGPNSAPVYLGCIDIDNITEPRGDIAEIWFCYDQATGEFVPRGDAINPPGPIAMAMAFDLPRTAHYLEQLGNCRFPVHVLHVSCGFPDVFNNWDRAFAFRRGKVTQTQPGPFMKTADGRVKDTFAIMGWPPLYRYFPIGQERVATTEDQDLNDIAWCNPPTCYGACGDVQPVCDVGYIACDSAAGPATANVLETLDGGDTWAATGADPFAADEHISAIECFPIDNDTTRILAARGVTDVGVAGEVAYSDDGGDTWMPVDLGAANGEFVLWPHAMFALNFHNIWVGTDLGNIYYSNDGGVSYTLQDATVIAANVRAIHAINASHVFVVGDGDDVGFTINGGTTWTAATPTGGGVHLYCVHMIGETHVWVGDSASNVYFTNDRGTTWTQREFEGDGAGTGVMDIEFLDELSGFFLHDEAGPVGRVMQTIDGGFDWKELATETNAGLNAISLCSRNSFWAVGNDQAATGVIIKGDYATPAM